MADPVRQSVLSDGTIRRFVEEGRIKIEHQGQLAATESRYEARPRVR